jgi:hypothetical protein
MADDEEESEPIVELGGSEPVEGVPLARVSSRQTWGMEKSRLIEREADTEIRTPEGPQRLGDVLDAIETVYFARRQDFEDEITNVIGTGPVPTASSGESDSASDDSGFDSEAGADAEESNGADPSETDSGGSESNETVESDPEDG